MPANNSTLKLCSIDGCAVKHYGHGWCGKHYARWRRHGDPLKTTTAPTGEPMKFIKSAVESDTDDCIIWPYGRLDSGYGAATEGPAHRVVLSLHTGVPLSTKLIAIHGPCHNRLCINKKHSSWGTDLENAADRIRDGTQAIGEAQGNAKLTETQVKKIRLRCEVLGESQSSVARRYGVSISNVSLIIRKKRWSYLWSD